MLRLTRVSSLTALLVALEGCAVHGGGKPAITGAGRVAPAAAAVSDDAFAAAVHDLLVSTPATTERAVRLGAVEARQMARADQRFKARATERGLAAVSGGLYLVRAHEALQGTFGVAGGDAIKAAARELALRGDEGRARALYNLSAMLGPEAERQEAQRHLAALDVWMHDALGS